jgi:hypothetical protein
MGRGFHSKVLNYQGISPGQNLLLHIITICRGINIQNPEASYDQSWLKPVPKDEISCIGDSTLCPAKKAPGGAVSVEINSEMASLQQEIGLVMVIHMDL